MFAPLAAKAQTKTPASSTGSLAHQRTTHRVGRGPAELPLTFQRAVGNPGMLRVLAAQRAVNFT